jgi:hypothetical protein
MGYIHVRQVIKLHGNLDAIDIVQRRNALSHVASIKSESNLVTFGNHFFQRVCKLSLQTRETSSPSREWRALFGRAILRDFHFGIIASPEASTGHDNGSYSPRIVQVLVCTVAQPTVHAGYEKGADNRAISSKMVSE